MSNAPVPGICERHQELEEAIQIMTNKLESIQSLLEANTELFKLKSQATDHRVRLVAAVGLLLVILAGMYVRPEVEKFWLYNVVGYSATGWLFGLEALNFWKNKNKTAAIITIGSIAAGIVKAMF